MQVKEALHQDQLLLKSYEAVLAVTGAFYFSAIGFITGFQMDFFCKLGSEPNASMFQSNQMLCYCMSHAAASIHRRWIF